MKRLAPPSRRKPRLGRPRKPDAGVPHARRAVNPRHPLHVTLRMRPHVWQLRSRRCFKILAAAFFGGCDRFGGRLCHFAVQHNHVHLLVEAEDATALARALQGMAIRMAKRLNHLMHRRGAVFADRYHARSLRTPTEVRRALVCVLGNGKKHLPQVGHRLSAGWLDPYSSAPWFDGWTVPPAPSGERRLVAAPKTWLLTTGYRRAGGLIDPEEAPRGP